MINKAYGLLLICALATGCGQSKQDKERTPAQETSIEASNDKPAEPAAKVTASASPDKLYMRCIACHGQDRSGVPSAFPALKDNIVALAREPNGRKYLVSALRYGIAGELVVNGQTYNGLMPAQYPSLNEADIAAVLNHLVQLDGGTNPSFTVDEVQSIIAELGPMDGNKVLALRH